MDWFETAQSAEFLALWKEFFADAAELLNGATGPRVSDRAYAERHALWVEIREPYDGVRLITMELPTDVRPPRVYLRVWTYDPQGDQIYNALEHHRYEWAGSQVVRYLNDRPQSSWQSQLNAAGVQVKGIRHYLNINIIAESQQVTVLQTLRDMLHSFCVHVATIADGSPGSATPVESRLEVPPELSSIAAHDPIAVQSVAADIPSQPNETFASEYQDLLGIDKDPRFSQEPPPVKVALANARIGQGGYRQRMLRVWDRRCALTGCSVEAVLVASHARPWSLCDTAHQCLDEYNGLLLSANLDRLFDQGLIAFADDGAVITSGDSAIDAMVTAERLRFLDPRHLPYLAWHRRHFGFG